MITKQAWDYWNKCNQIGIGLMRKKMPMTTQAQEVEIYPDERVMEELARLSQHTCDETQSRIQAVYMWMRERPLAGTR